MTTWLLKTPVLHLIVLHLILGGAAVHRCDNCIVSIPALAAAVRRHRGHRFFRTS
jgi:hypothetical protein